MITPSNISISIDGAGKTNYKLNQEGSMNFQRAIFLSLMVLWFLPPIGSALTLADEPGYAIIMANGTKIKILEYSIDLRFSTITYKSLHSGITATFPLERIRKVVAYDPELGDISKDAPAVYENTSVVSTSNDDEGIPVLFKVTTQSVGGGSGSNQTKGSKSGQKSSRQTGKGSSSSSSTSSSQNKNSSTNPSNYRAQTTGSNTSSSSSSNRSQPTNPSSSNPASPDASDFFNALFGGNK
jgi:hypothetical protein